MKKLLKTEREEISATTPHTLYKDIKKIPNDEVTLSD